MSNRRNSMNAKDMEAKDRVETLRIPFTEMEPGSHRCFVVSTVASEIKLAGGLVVPGMNQIKDHNKNPLTIVKKRYFIVKVAGDFTVDHGKPEVKLEMGDEVWPLGFDGVTPIILPEVEDWQNGAFRYGLLHDSEIMAYRKTPKEELRKI